MTATDSPLRLSDAPSLHLPWMHALIRAGAQFARSEAAVTDANAKAGYAVHYVLCGDGPGTVKDGTDFLTAIAKARRLVATGAGRIVFLTFGDTPDGRLHQSLNSFVHHANRALTAHRAEFAVIPIHRPPASAALPTGVSAERPENHSRAPLETPSSFKENVASAS